VGVLNEKSMICVQEASESDRIRVVMVLLTIALVLRKLMTGSHAMTLAEATHPLRSSLMSKFEGGREIFPPVSSGFFHRHVHFYFSVAPLVIQCLPPRRKIRDILYMFFKLKLDII
jgi:hypothetical protein